MNTTQLRKLGVPEACITPAIQAIQLVAKAGRMKGTGLRQQIREIVEQPELHTGDADFGAFAQSVIADRGFIAHEPVSYQTWGTDIDPGAHVQMQQACTVPVAVDAALMPDAHIGYGLPIGGVLACDNAVIPYAVGVDIACRMKLSILDLPAESLTSKALQYEHALEKGTRFGVGGAHEKPQDHAVMDEDWSVTRVTREYRDKAWKQLGTSGSGNHFVEFGLLTLPARDEQLGLDAGEYVSLLSHSGSRGTGAAVCSVYSSIAQSRLPSRYSDLGRLGWLGLDTEAGQEYWAAMNLMGEYAAANHAVIHRLVSKLLGAKIVAGVENHHNFAWKEIHNGREVIVHRKGCDAGRSRSPGSDPWIDGQPGIRGPRKGKCSESVVGIARGRSLHVTHQGPRYLQLEVGEKRPGRQGSQGPVSRRRRSALRLQRHPRSDGSPNGPGRYDRPF